MSKKVLVVGGEVFSSYYQPFDKYGEFTGDETLLETNPDIINLVVFTGGEDVDPSLYKEAKNNKTYSNLKRDIFEKSVFEKSIQKKKPIAGICRGSQFICAMSGGKLVQHLNGHSGYHNIITNENEIIKVSSTHHQMQLPPKTAIPIAWSDPKLSNIYEGPNNVYYDIDKEHDIVYYPNTNAIGMQYHPEYMSINSPGFQYVEKLIDKFLEIEKY